MKNKILIAVDLDDDYLYVVKKGLELAKYLDAKVILTSIINIYVNYIQADISATAVQWEEIYTAQVDHTKKELEKIKNENKNLEFNIYVERGDSKLDILERANEENVNYIVIGTHGRTGISHVFMGSTAEYVIRHSTKPVVVIPMNTLQH